MVTKADLSGFMRLFDSGIEHDEILILDGEPFKADLAYQKIYRRAKRKIMVIDDYISTKTLQHLLHSKEGKLMPTKQNIKERIDRKIAEKALGSESKSPAMTAIKAISPFLRLNSRIIIQKAERRKLTFRGSDLRIKAITDKALDGGGLEEPEIVALLQMNPYSEEASYIRRAAWFLARRASGGIAEIHAQIGIDGSSCPRNCEFCSFAACNGLRSSRLEMPKDEIIGYRTSHFHVRILFTKLFLKHLADLTSFLALLFHILDGLISFSSCFTSLR